MGEDQFSTLTTLTLALKLFWGCVGETKKYVLDDRDYPANQNTVAAVAEDKGSAGYVQEYKLYAKPLSFYLDIVRKSKIGKKFTFEG